MKALIAMPQERAAADFITLAALLTQVRGDLAELRRAGEDPRLPTRVKDAIPAMTTPESYEFQTVSTAYVETLRHFGVFDRVLADGARRVPLRVALRSTTLVPTVEPRYEAAPAVVGRVELGANRLAPRAASGIVVLSNGFIDAGGPALQGHIERELRRAIVAATDRIFVPELVSTVGTGMTIASTGDTSAHVKADIKASLAALGATAESKPFLIASGARVRSLAFMDGDGETWAWPDLTFAGGNIGGIPVLPTDAIADDTALVVDASRIAADSAGLQIKASNQGSVRMRDFTETGDGDDLGAVVSLFQNELTGLFGERVFGFSPIDDAAVVLSDVNWGDAT